jgi:hypothetical protein
MQMNREKATTWLALTGSVIFLALLWRRMVRMPANQDAEHDSSKDRKNRPVAEIPSTFLKRFNDCRRLIFQA